MHFFCANQAKCVNVVVDYAHMHAYNSRCTIQACQRNNNRISFRITQLSDQMK